MREPDFLESSSAHAVNENALKIASECYCSREALQDALGQLPNFGDQLIWDPPCHPDPDAVNGDADLVLVVTDSVSLPEAIGRLGTYKNLRRASILLCLADDSDLQGNSIPGLVLPPSQLASGIYNLALGLLVPSITQGLICIDWHDTKHLLAMDGQLLVEGAAGDELGVTTEAALSHLVEHVSGRQIQGLQASILCSRNKLNNRNVLYLLSKCKEAIGDEAMLIIGAPFLDVPESSRCEVRLVSKVA